MAEPGPLRGPSRAKRAFDLFWTVAGLAVLWPLLALVALAIRLDDAGPVFYRQVRIGRHGRPFRIFKFRTMVADADRRGRLLTVGRDPRITRVGHWLRRTKVDELPQLLNVLTGEMSLVGPRPELPHHVALYTAEQRRVLELLPGLTDPASLAFRDEAELLAGEADPEQAYVCRIMPQKLALKIEYGARATRWSDFVMILETLRLVARARPSRDPLPGAGVVRASHVTRPRALRERQLSRRKP